MVVTYYDGHFVTYTNMEPLRCIPAGNVVVGVSYISIKDTRAGVRVCDKPHPVLLRFLLQRVGGLWPGRRREFL